MNFRAKALIQKAISLIPGPLSYEVYYQFQRKLGGLKKIDPSSKISAGEKIVGLASKADFSLKGKRILEIGSGRSPILPLTLWLHGASSIVTVDLNPYFKEEIWIESLVWLKANQEIVLKSNKGIDRQRLNQILENEELFRKGKILKCLHQIGIDYLAPADARMLPFDDNYFDAHISYTVLEHIPREILKDIFEEAKRIVRPSGAMIHNIDYSDHFSHSDKHISAINFLKYSRDEFNLMAGNKFMYMNRLRDDDFRNLWNELSLFPRVSDKKTSGQLLALLRSNKSPTLHEDFATKTIEDLSLIESWYVFIL